MILFIIAFILCGCALLFLFIITTEDEKSCYECVYARIDAGVPAFGVRCRYKKGYHNHREICEKWRKL